MSVGFCIFFTGLSGAGKTTLATLLDSELRSITGRPTSVLDGDVIRTHLTRELGFSRHDRDLNIRRIGYVAGEIVKHGGIAIVSVIAPFDSARQAARQLVALNGGFYLVHVSTSLAVCEKRDTKGLYAKARAGLVLQFTGVSDPYEEPADAELVIDTSCVAEADAVQLIISRLRRDGFLS